MERMELRDEELRVSVVHARSSVADRCSRHRGELEPLTQKMARQQPKNSSASW